MAFARLSDSSDIYFFPNVSGKFDCFWCPLHKAVSWSSRSKAMVFIHLVAHMAAGHKVPRSVFSATWNWRWNGEK